MKTLPFTIDSHLLRELGERLVGRHYIALAELVKNAYDADANNCEILFTKDSIEIWDDGHGMTFEEFRNFWMRIGTTNKMQQKLSRKHARPLTGSKGIGRLAVQFLGRRVRIVTTPAGTSANRLYAEVDWDAAIASGELTKAVARYELSKRHETYASGSPVGTKVILQGLNHAWVDATDSNDSPVRELARAVWMLQPPFADALRATDAQSDLFRIELVSIDKRMEQIFRSQLAAVLKVWDARIEGEIRSGRQTQRCTVTVAFRDGDRYETAIPIAADLLDDCSFEVRIFKLYGKQPEKIGVEKAREYFKDFGGVHVYDSGFRLPYYGIEQDWLGIQLDHSHRLSRSKLLPTELDVPLAMHDLPTTERIFGVVRINTTRELRRASRTAQDAGRFLKINVGRDRLVDNAAYQELRRVVRWSIDYYATRFQLRQERKVGLLRPTESPQTKLRRLRGIIEQVKLELPPPLQRKLVEEVNDYYESVEREGKYVERQMSLVAPLAAAGLASLAFEHEDNRQIRGLERLVQRLLHLDPREGKAREELHEIAEAVHSWIKQHRGMRRIFSALTTEDDRQDVRRLRAKPTAKAVLLNTRSLLRDLEADASGIPADLLLPLGTMAEWQALIQNLLVNASNAMLDSTEKRIRISGGALDRRTSYLQISDTGVGVDTKDSKGLFEPFVRGLEISSEQRSLGLAGMGLGLTIVRMICETRKCRYAFVEPEEYFSTTFRMTWIK